MPGSLPPLIPREVLFGNPDKASPQVSPDGALLAYLAPDDGVLNVWVRTLGQQDDRPVTRDRKRGIRAFQWAYDGRRLLYVQDQEGDENWHVWSVELATGVIRDMTPFQGVQAQIAGLHHRFPNEMLVGLNLRDARLHDVHRVDLATGAVTLDTENPGDVVAWLPDPEFRIRAAYAALPDGGFQLRVRDTGDAPAWRPLLTWGPEEEGRPLGFTPDGTGIYVGSSLGTDTEELRVVDIRSCAEETLAGNPEVDLAEVIANPLDHHVEAVGFNRDRLRWHVLDEAVAGDLDSCRARRKQKCGWPAGTWPTPRGSCCTRWTGSPPPTTPTTGGIGGWSSSLPRGRTWSAMCWRRCVPWTSAPGMGSSSPRTLVSDASAGSGARGAPAGAERAWRPLGAGLLGL